MHENYRIDVRMYLEKPTMWYINFDKYLELDIHAQLICMHPYDIATLSID